MIREKDFEDMKLWLTKKNVLAYFPNKTHILIFFSQISRQNQKVFEQKNFLLFPSYLPNKTMGRTKRDVCWCSGDICSRQKELSMFDQEQTNLFFSTKMFDGNEVTISKKDIWEPFSQQKTNILKFSIHRTTLVNYLTQNNNKNNELLCSDSSLGFKFK